MFVRLCILLENVIVIVVFILKVVLIVDNLLMLKYILYLDMCIVIVYNIFFFKVILFVKINENLYFLVNFLCIFFFRRIFLLYDNVIIIKIDIVVVI